MNEDGKREQSNYTTSVKFLHLVDHNGTIFNLVSPLGRFPEHRILTSFDFSLEDSINIIEDLLSKNDAALILHSTGNSKPFYSIKDKLLKMSKQSYIFLHVSPKHFMLKNRENELKSIKSISDTYGSDILTPSQNISQELKSKGLNARPIQVGIDFNEAFYDNSRKRYISTVCTSEEPIYQRNRCIF